MVKTNDKIEMIKDVAIFLRKSRGEEEDLEKHKQDLVELCENNGWRYVIYEELGTSTDIEFRPETKQLLNDIAEDLYDGVVVIDKDRLSRESTGQALINKTLTDNDCLIITPTRIYDLNNESDILMTEVEDLFARIEYRAISKRFRRGKRRGAKMGNWVNGTPPFPYEYNSEIKGLVPNKEKLKWYRFMIDKFMEGWTFEKIAWELNTIGIKTQRNGVWHENAVRRVLLSEVHLGKVIFNKTTGSGHKNKKTKPLEERPKEEWIVVENCHESVKTQSEHDTIMAVLSSRRKVPKHSKQIKLPLASIVKCSKCGSTMQVYRRKTAKGEHILELKRCYKKDHFGNPCTNRGGGASIILDYILEEVKLKKHEYAHELSVSKGSSYSSEEHYKLKQEIARNEMVKKEESLERSYIAYEEGVITLEKYKKRQDEVRKQVEKLRKEVESYDFLIKESSVKNKQKEIERLVELADEISKYDDIGNEEMNIKLNERIKDVIYDITWLREGNDVTVQVNFK